MATSNNPRKFSEKIALHHQKQAEETAAFDEVMKDLNISRAARVTAPLHLLSSLPLSVSELTDACLQEAARSRRGKQKQTPQLSLTPLTGPEPAGRNLSVL